MLDANSKILLVDDLELTRKMIRQSLEKLGFQKIDDAKDGLDALDKIFDALEAKSPYTLMFLDWNMPNLSGIQVLEECRKSPKLKDFIIIMVTAEAEKKNVLAALMAGANDYVVKPCSAEILKAKIVSVQSLLAKKVG